MCHALAPDFGLGNFHTAFFTNNTTVLETLIFSAETFIVLYGPEYLGAEKSVTLRLEGPVVDGFRFFYLAIRPRSNHVRRRQPDMDSVKILDLGLLTEKS